MRPGEKEYTQTKREIKPVISLTKILIILSVVLGIIIIFLLEIKIPLGNQKMIEKGWQYGIIEWSFEKVNTLDSFRYFSIQPKENSVWFILPTLEFVFGFNPYNSSYFSILFNGTMEAWYREVKINPYKEAKFIINFKIKDEDHLSVAIIPKTGKGQILLLSINILGECEEQFNGWKYCSRKFILSNYTNFTSQDFIITIIVNKKAGITYPVSRNVLIKLLSLEQDEKIIRLI